MTAPALPVAPATLVVTPDDKIHENESRPNESAIERATREATARLEAGGTNIPTETPAPAGGRERNPDGTFKEAPKAADDRAPAAGHGAPAADPKPGETPAPAAGEAPPTGTETLAGEELVVQLPGRNAGDDVEIEAPTPEIAERLRQLTNGYMRGNEVRAAAESVMRERDAIEREYLTAQLDPAGFILTAIEDQPELTLADGSTVNVLDHLVLYLASQPDVWQRIGDRLVSLDDEAERRGTRGDQIALRNAVNAQLATATETRAQVRQNLQDVQATIGSILPAEMPEEQQQLLYRDCLTDLKAHADRYGMMTIPVHDIPVILAQRLTAYGINPVEAAARASESATRRGNAAARRPAPGARPAASAAPTPKAPAAPSGQRFVVSAASKRAAATPAAGSGSPAATGAITPPLKADGSKMGIQETLDWHRGLRKAGRKLL